MNYGKPPCRCTLKKGRDEPSPMTYFLQDTSATHKEYEQVQVLLGGLWDFKRREAEARQGCVVLRCQLRSGAAKFEVEVSSRSATDPARTCGSCCAQPRTTLRERCSISPACWMKIMIKELLC